MCTFYNKDCHKSDNVFDIYSFMSKNISFIHAEPNIQINANITVFVRTISFVLYETI